MTPPFSWKLRNKTIWVAGHQGMVGQALMRRLARENCVLSTATRDEADLRRQTDVEQWLAANRPDAIVIAAATVGGIADNAARPADFLYDNLMIAANIIEAAHRLDIQRLLFLGSSCIYPREAPQPMAEEALLSGPLEPTNEAYALAKIAGVKLCQSYRRQHGRSYIAAMPCNLYGPGDRFDAERSHVIPALIMKMAQARDAGQATFPLWGTGNALREFLHVDDLADALVLLLQAYDGETPVNVGSGEEMTIRALASMVAAAVGYTGDLTFDASRPDGPPRKLMDGSKLRAMSWTPRIAFGDGLRQTCEFFERSRTA